MISGFISIFVSFGVMNFVLYSFLDSTLLNKNEYGRNKRGGGNAVLLSRTTLFSEISIIFCCTNFSFSV